MIVERKRSCPLCVQYLVLCPGPTMAALHTRLGYCSGPFSLGVILARPYEESAVRGCARLMHWCKVLMREQFH